MELSPDNLSLDLKMEIICDIGDKLFKIELTWMMYIVGGLFDLCMWFWEG